MLVKFVIDPSSLADAGSDAVRRRAACERLVTLWQELGVLVHDGQALELSALAKEIALLPVTLRTMWQSLFKISPVARGPASWTGTTKSILDVGTHGLQREVSVLFVEDTIAEVEFAVPEDRSSQKVPELGGIEVCRIEMSDRSEAFLQARDLAQQPIPGGLSAQELWDRRFKSLIQYGGDQITIVDAYAMGHFHSLPVQTISGLERFIRWVARDAIAKKTIVIYSAWTDKLRGVNAAKLAGELNESIRKLERTDKIRKLSLVMAPKACFRDDSHGRFIRVGRHVFEIDTGIEIFQGSNVPRNCQASLKSRLYEFYHDIEESIGRDRQAQRWQAFPQVKPVDGG